MNIFVLDEDPAVAAQSLCDKHVPKMLVETAQLLCGIFPPGVAPYRRTHYNHPCAIWSRAAALNYMWLLEHGRQLAQEYWLRYGRHSNKTHASAPVLEFCAKKFESLSFPGRGLTPFVQAMPEEYRGPNAVKAYRAYYLGVKSGFAQWKKGRPAPAWWPVLDNETRI